MKYTYESLNNAIFKIIPQYETMSNNGIAGNQPMMLKAVAEKYFIDMPHKDRRDFELMCAYDVCQQALIDLHEKGCFNFT